MSANSDEALCHIKCQSLDLNTIVHWLKTNWLQTNIANQITAFSFPLVDPALSSSGVSCGNTAEEILKRKLDINPSLMFTNE